MSIKTLSGIVFSAGLLALGAGVGAQDAAQVPAAPPVRKLELKFNNDRVTLKAQNVTVREVLAEWAKQCGCEVIGADKITNTTITMPLQYENQPKEAIIRSLLNPGTVSGGYLLTQDKLVIAPVSHPSALPTYTQTTSSPVAAPLVTNENDELPPPNIPALQQTNQNPPPDQNRPTAPGTPVGVLPVSGVPPVGGARTGAPGTPGTPTVPPPGGGRGGL